LRKNITIGKIAQMLNILMIQKYFEKPFAFVPGILDGFGKIIATIRIIEKKTKKYEKKSKNTKIYEGTKKKTI
jgi:hypothetical protein